MNEARTATVAKPKTAKGRLIEVRGLDKTFYDADREIRVLRHLDLNVEAEKIREGRTERRIEGQR